MKLEKIFEIQIVIIYSNKKKVQCKKNLNLANFAVLEMTLTHYFLYYSSIFILIVNSSL